MTEWREEEKAITDACHATEAAEEAKVAACSVVSSCESMARQAMVFRQSFNGLGRVLVLFPPLEHRCQGQSVRQSGKKRHLYDEGDREGRLKSGGEGASSARTKKRKFRALRLGYLGDRGEGDCVLIFVSHLALRCSFYFRFVL